MFLLRIQHTAAEPPTSPHRFTHHLPALQRRRRAGLFSVALVVIRQKGFGNSMPRFFGPMPSR